VTTNFWQGNLVRLRAIEPEDDEHFFRWNMDSERARHLDFVWPPTSRVSVREWTERQSRLKLEDNVFHWVIENRAGEPVGSISTHNCEPRCGTFSYGVDVAAEHRGNGYAGEAITLVLRYYFYELRYQKCTVCVHADNPSSIRLHEKLGYTLEGTWRRMFFTQGHYVDLHWFGITREEFEGRCSQDKV
jgi:RimJ/RimL family protein N-acetyltransferase